MSGEGGAIAEVLAGHLIGYEPRAYPAYVCYCGWDGAQGDDGSESVGQHDNAAAANEHVAAALIASPALADLLAAERQRGREEALREAAVTVRALTEVGDLTREPWDNGYRCAVRDALRDINAALVDVPAESEGA